jgi:hypothetical protein
VLFEILAEAERIDGHRRLSLLFLFLNHNNPTSASLFVPSQTAAGDS